MQYTDPAQAALRRRIALQIQEHYSSGWLDEERARTMLSELGYRSDRALHVKRHVSVGEQEMIDEVG